MQFELPLSAAPPVLIEARGARAAEAALLSLVDELIADARRAPALLARPVRVIVPTRSLRLHVAAAIGRHAGRPALGVVVQTLYGAAAEILAAAGQAPAAGALLGPIIARRHARDEPALAHVLGPLVGGWGAVARSVEDLLAAGFSPGLADPVDELLDDRRRAVAGPPPQADAPGAPGALWQRARAICRVAARTRLTLGALGLGDRLATVLRASELLAQRDGLLPARAILLHGFADADAVTADLLDALLRAGAGRTRVVVSRPADQAQGVAAPLTTPFIDGLTPRARVYGAVQPAAAPPPAERLDTFVAADVSAEAREIARRAYALIAAGVAPEQIGVVTRDMGPYRAALRVHFERLAVPFSGVAEVAPRSGAARRWEGVLRLLERRGDAPLDAWLELVAPNALASAATPDVAPTALPAGWRHDLRVAFRVLGASRLDHVAHIRVPAGDLELPVRGADGRSGARRRVSRALLAAATAAARRLSARFDDWPSDAPFAAHLDAVIALVTGDLGWSLDDAGDARVIDALSGLAALPGAARVPLLAEDLAGALEPLVAAHTSAPLGGRGGGVQILGAWEARARTFDHLFVAGLNRGVFPRPRVEDPLLPDHVRTALRALLPDLTTGGAGESERHLFGDLLSAAPCVTLSWRLADDAGRPLTASSLVERLSRRHPPAWITGRGADDDGVPRPLAEHAIAAARAGDRAALADALGAAAGRPDVGHARRRVLDELEPDLSTDAGRARAGTLGPWFGLVGPPRSPQDPRHKPLFVTTLERYAGCPWQTFVERLLRLEPAPDPLEGLPQLDARLQGQVLHEILEAIVQVAAPVKGANVIALAQTPDAPRVPWPDDAAVAAISTRVAARVLADSGVFYGGLARALATHVQSRLAVARAVDWADGPEVGPRVLGSEVEGHATVRDVRGADRVIRFRADRLDRVAGGLRLTDYKRSRSPIGGRKPDVRRQQLVDRIKLGSALQGAAYAHALVSLGGGEGRYLYLTPDDSGRGQEVAVPADDAALLDAFETTVQTLLAGWDTGAFFPRLTEADGDREPTRCGYCQVAEACVRGDSGARRRLVTFASERGPGAPPPEDAALRAVLALWDLRTQASPALLDPSPAMDEYGPPDELEPDDVDPDFNPWSGGGA